MKKLILLLLIVGCEEPAIEGCMDDTACNYNSEATVDDGSCEYFDECGVCAGDGSSCSSTVTDIDGNVYETVQIGEQLWMAKNLKVTKYRDGSEIPNITSDIYWSNLSTSAYAVYDNNFSNADIYGNLYNWYAVDDDRGVCPEGWHVPTDEQFMELEMYLGMSEEEANSLFERGTNEGSQLAGNSDLWQFYAGGLVDNPEFGTSGLTFLPAGFRHKGTGGYHDMGEEGFFWSSSEYDSSSAWARRLNYDFSPVYRAYSGKLGGFSIRCLGD